MAMRGIWKHSLNWLPLSCQQIRALLFEPKRGHGVDASRPLPTPLRKNGVTDECDEIPRFDTKEEAGQEASEPERCPDAQDHADAGEDHALTDVTMLRRFNASTRMTMGTLYTTRMAMGSIKVLGARPGNPNVMKRANARPVSREGLNSKGRKRLRIGKDFGLTSTKKI
jgi:hypothetical protein